MCAECDKAMKKLLDLGRKANMEVAQLRLRPVGVRVNAGIHYSANYTHFVKVVARITKWHPSHA